MSDRFDLLNAIIKGATKNPQYSGGKTMYETGKQVSPDKSADTMIKSVGKADKETKNKGKDLTGQSQKITASNANPDRTTTGLLIPKPASLLGLARLALSYSNSDNMVAKTAAAVAYLNAMNKISARVMSEESAKKHNVTPYADKKPVAEQPTRKQVQWTPELNALARQRGGLQRGSQEWAQLQNRINSLMGDPTKHRGIPSGPAIASANSKPATAPSTRPTKPTYPSNRGMDEHLFIGQNLPQSSKNYNMDALYGVGFSNAGVPNTEATANRAMADAGVTPPKQNVLANEMEKVKTSNPGLAMSVAQNRINKGNSAQSYSFPNLEYGPSIPGPKKVEKKPFGEIAATKMENVGNDVNVGLHYSSIADEIAMGILGIKKDAWAKRLEKSLIQAGLPKSTGRLSTMRNLNYKNYDDLLSKDFSSIAQQPGMAELLSSGGKYNMKNIGLRRALLGGGLASAGGYLAAR